MKNDLKYLLMCLFLIFLYYSSGYEAGSSDMPSLTEIFNKFGEKKNYQIFDGPEVYDGANLIEIEKEIADVIIEYKVEEGCRATIISERNDMTYVVKLFVFPSQVHAFGFYSVEKSPSLDFYDIGFQSYETGQKLSSWYGNYVLFVHSPDTLESRGKNIREFARDFINILPRQRKSTPLLDCLPQKNFVEHSEKFYIHRWLARDYFKNIYYADYYTPEGYSRIFIIDNKFTAVADTNFWNYYNFMKENSEIFHDTLKIATDYVIVNEPLWGKTILAKKNQIIYGVLDVRNASWVEDRLAELLNELKKKKIVKSG